MFEDFERYYLNGVRPTVGITTSELTAHLEGTFKERYDIAKRNWDRSHTEEHRIVLQEAQRTYDTVYGILYEFDEANGVYDQ